MRQHDYEPRPTQLKWLLNSDPAVRWQVMRDLTDEAPNAVAVERSRIATEGWGAQLLARQSRAGNWGGPSEDRGLLITLYSLVVLMDLGLDPFSKQARKMIDRVDNRLVFKPLNNRPFLNGETEPCINGRILALGAYFKEPNDALARQLLREQLEDGGALVLQLNVLVVARPYSLWLRSWATATLPFRADHGQSGSYAPQQTFNDAGQKSSSRTRSAFLDNKSFRAVLSALLEFGGRPTFKNALARYAQRQRLDLEGSRT